MGNAVMTQGGTVLKADQITMMRKQHIAHAYGHVHLIDPEVEIWATRADIDLEKETLELEDAKILAKRNTYHLEGKPGTRISYSRSHSRFGNCRIYGSTDAARCSAFSHTSIAISMRSIIGVNKGSAARV